MTPPAGPGRSLEELLVEAGIPALEGIDTRALTLELRRGAARRAVIRPAGDDAQALREAREVTGWDAVDHVAAVSTPRRLHAPRAMGRDEAGPRSSTSA